MSYKTKQTDYSAVDYRRSIRSAVHAYWDGNIDLMGFLDSMLLAIHRGFTRAWYEGAQQCGISQNELTNEERQALNFQINSEISHILSFGEVIGRSRKANGGKIGALYLRADMWAGRYSMIRDMARSYACADQKLKWVLGARREHCSDCVRLNNRVYRASTWRKYDLYPRKSSLECGGWRCGCEFEATNDPCTPGRPPAI